MAEGCGVVEMEVEVWGGAWMFLVKVGISSVTRPSDFWVTFALLLESLGPV